MIDITEDEEYSELTIKYLYFSIEKYIIDNDNHNNNNNNNNIINNNKYEFNIIINTMGYEEDFEPPTKKIKLGTMPVEQRK
jgi:hypothetical protein